jgi:hypothetical protein
MIVWGGSTPDNPALPPQEKNNNRIWDDVLEVVHFVANGR